MHRKHLKDAGRIVVKIGSKSLVDENGRLDLQKIEGLAQELSWAHQSGREVILVSSGAIVAGLESLGLKERPKDLPQLQAAAAIGQGQLMHLYQIAFSKQNIQIAQVLLTAEDLKERRRHLNAKNTFEALLSQKVIPIVNENDTVAVEEIRFGDNDQLSALVANLVKADLLVLLTDQDGFLKDGSVVDIVFKIDKDLESLAHQAKDWKGIGGMQTKLNAAKVMMRSGEFMLIANSSSKGVMQKILNGESVGTLFIPQGTKMPGKKRWIAHFVAPKGVLRVDDGAAAAICERGRSLLAPGIIEIEGVFESGDTVSVCNARDEEIARGIIHYSHEELKTLLEKKAVGKIFDSEQKKEEVIHRDNLVIL